MEQILELITQNLFFVVIVIGGIFSLLNRKNKGQQEQQGQQPQQHRQNSQQERPRSEKIDWREIFKQEEFGFPKTIQNQSPPIVHVEKAESILADTEQPLQSRLNEFKRGKAEISDSLKVDRNIRSNGTSVLNLNLDRLSGTEAMKGIVLAEVLGAPRSKQTYGRNYPQRTK